VQLCTHPVPLARPDFECALAACLRQFPALSRAMESTPKARRVVQGHGVKRRPTWNLVRENADVLGLLQRSRKHWANAMAAAEISWHCVVFERGRADVVCAFIYDRSIFDAQSWPVVWRFLVQPTPDGSGGGQDTAGRDAAFLRAAYRNVGGGSPRWGLAQAAWRRTSLRDCAGRRRHNTPTGASRCTLLSTGALAAWNRALASCDDASVALEACTAACVAMHVARSRGGTPLRIVRLLLHTDLRTLPAGMHAASVGAMQSWVALDFPVGCLQDFRMAAKTACCGIQAAVAAGDALLMASVADSVRTPCLFKACALVERHLPLFDAQVLCVRTAGARQFWGALSPSRRPTVAVFASATGCSVTAPLPAAETLAPALLSVLC